jgi:purine-binding chemotaxis protein CheW
MSGRGMVGATGDAGIQILTLGLQGEVFAIEARQVREILDLVPVTEVPGAPAFLNGLINVRGKVVPLSDLRLKLGMQTQPPTIDSRIVVVEIEIESEPTVVGLRADKVFEMAELPGASLAETPPIGMRLRPEYVRCIAKRGSEFILVLDLPAFFAAAKPTDPAAAAPRPLSLVAAA